MSEASFIEAEGEVHLVSPLNGEFTLCGDAFDGGTHIPGYKWERTSRRVVTCPHCAAIVRDCRGVRVLPPQVTP